MSKLKKLYEKLIEKPQKPWREIIDLGWELSAAFLKEAEQVDYLQGCSQQLSWFVHEFRGALLKGYIPAVNSGLNSIKKFIDTCRFDEYAIVNLGDRYLKSENRVRKYIYDELKHKFIPIYQKDELVNMLNEIERKVTENGELRFDHFAGPFSKEHYEYLLEYKSEYFPD